MKAWSGTTVLKFLSFRLVNVPFPKKHLIIVLEWQWVCEAGVGGGVARELTYILSLIGKSLLKEILE